MPPKILVLTLLLLLSWCFDAWGSNAQTKNTTRIWIDTDLACGINATTDVDDCLALAMMLTSPKFRVVGISTVFGNASLDDVGISLRRFRSQYKATYSGSDFPTTYPGASKRTPRYKPPIVTEASKAIATYFKDNTGVLLALGPLSNIAAAILQSPEIVSNIETLVIVGGTTSSSRRFFPGNTRATSFRDFNLIKDKQAVQIVIGSAIKIQLAGYELGAAHLITNKDLENLDLKQPLKRYLIKAAAPWQAHWKDKFDINGFYPFDLMAAKSLLKNGDIECEKSTVKIKKSRLLGLDVLHSLKIGEGTRVVTRCL